MVYKGVITTLSVINTLHVFLSYYASCAMMPLSRLKGEEERWAHDLSGRAQRGRAAIGLQSTRRFRTLSFAPRRRHWTPQTQLGSTTDARLRPRARRRHELPHTAVPRPPPATQTVTVPLFFHRQVLPPTPTTTRTRPAVATSSSSPCDRPFRAAQQSTPVVDADAVSVRAREPNPNCADPERTAPLALPSAHLRRTRNVAVVLVSPYTSVPVRPC